MDVEQLGNRAVAGDGIRKDTLIRKVDPEYPDARQIREAALLIRQGGVVAYPTESYYGLGVDPWSEDSVRHLFRVKKRQQDQPILLLVDTVFSLDRVVHHVSPSASRLMESFWPGGLTLVFRASDRVLPALTAGTGKIGIRLSSNPVAAALVRGVGGFLTGTSANLSGKPPCRAAQEVFQQLGESVDMILDGGLTGGESASTVVDVSEDQPRILREGMISREQLQPFFDNAFTMETFP